MATETVVVNIHYEPCDVLITRPGSWGNPFRIGRDGTRDEVCDRHAVWIRTQPHLLARLGELRGKRLGCVCSPARCHGDTLAKLAEEGDGG